jgi:branched-chain amino acid transport system permease protein
MAGGYVTVVLVNRLGAPFPLALAAAFVLPALVGLALERTLYVHLYRRSHLDQVLFSIGLVFMAMSAVDYIMGAQQQLIQLPDYLRGQVSLAGGVSIGAYRLFIIVVCGLLTVALQLVLARTRFGSRLRAAVDDPGVARGLGINVDGIFAAAFAVGSGLAGLGGALGIEVLGLDPTFPVKFMIYFLIVVVVGGTTSITGPFFTSIVLGIGDIAGKYYVPELGAFVIYTMMVVILVVRPEGLFSRAEGRG